MSNMFIILLRIKLNLVYDGFEEVNKEAQLAI